MRPKRIKIRIAEGSVIALNAVIGLFGASLIFALLSIRQIAKGIDNNYFEAFRMFFEEISSSFSAPEIFLMSAAIIVFVVFLVIYIRLIIFLKTQIAPDAIVEIVLDKKGIAIIYFAANKDGNKFEFIPYNEILGLHLDIKTTFYSKNEATVVEEVCATIKLENRKIEISQYKDLNFAYAFLDRWKVFRGNLTYEVQGIKIENIVEKIEFREQNQGRELIMSEKYLPITWLAFIGPLAHFTVTALANIWNPFVYITLAPILIISLVAGGVLLTYYIKKNYKLM